MVLQNIIANILKRKTPDDAVEGASKGGLEKTLFTQNYPNQKSGCNA